MRALGMRGLRCRQPAATKAAGGLMGLEISVKLYIYASNIHHGRGFDRGALDTIETSPTDEPRLRLFPGAATSPAQLCVAVGRARPAAAPLRVAALRPAPAALRPLFLRCLPTLRSVAAPLRLGMLR